LLAHPAIAAVPDPVALYHYLTFLAAPAPLTLFQGIYKLPAGWALTIEASGRPTAWSYWDPAAPAEERPGEPTRPVAAVEEEALVRAIRERLHESVRTHLVADVPLGVFLSGGIDSSLLVALARRVETRPIDTFTVGFSDHPRDNELGAARRVARAFGTAHHEILVDERQMRAYLPALAHEQDEPIADWACIPLHFLARAARAAGVTAVLVGEGSDEQFAGYDLYLRYLRSRRAWDVLCGQPRRVRSALAALAGGAWRVSGRGGHYADLLDRAARGGDLFWGGAVSFWELPKRRLVRRDRVTATPAPLGLEAFVPAAFLAPDSAAVVGHYRTAAGRAISDPLARMIYLELKLRLPELLLMRVDRITMAASVEARVPFLDHRLVEMTLGVPMAVKVKDGVPKHLLKRVCAGILPRDVIDRPKVGFAAPMAAWLRGEFGRAAESTVLGSGPVRDGILDAAVVRGLFRRHRAGGDASLAIWTLYTLADWYGRWIGGSRAA
jgi:asparagine synthase (glutamine-hydrolysing)